MKKLIVSSLLLSFLAACGLMKTEPLRDTSSSTLATEEKSSTSAKITDVPAGATCRSRTAALQRAERLLVTITTKFAIGAPTEFGAGIILSIKGNTAYILTADHVVRKSTGGKPSILVAVEAADGTTRQIKAEVATRFTWSSDLYKDIALLQADVSRSGPVMDWAILRSAQSSNNLKDFVAIGNPAGRGKTATPKGDADYKSTAELRVNSGVMEPGYSGGGVFDAQMHLAGMVFEDRGQYAAAYPIDPILNLLRTAGVPVDLATASDAKKNIFLSDVQGSTPEIEQAARAAITQALVNAGFEPQCSSQNAYKLSLLLKGMTTSGTSSAVEMVPTLLGPDGGQLQVDKVQVSFLHMLGLSPLSSPDALSKKMSEAAEAIVSKVTAKMK